MVGYMYDTVPTIRIGRDLHANQVSPFRITPI